MARMSDIYAKLKARWQRFERWERRVFFHQVELCIPAFGTLEEFEERFRFLIHNVPKAHFFDRSYEFRRFRTRAYYDDGEFGILVANPVLSFLTYGYWSAIWTNYYTFYGIAEEYDGQIVVRGTTDHGSRFAKLVTVSFNIILAFGVLFFAAGMVSTLWRLVFGNPTTELVASISVTLFAPIIVIFGFAMTYFLGSIFTLYDRAASVKIRRLLEDVCGAPSQYVEAQR